MKILQVIHGFPPKQKAGTEIYTYYLSKELAKRHEVHVFYPEHSNTKRIFLRTLESGGLIIHKLRIPYGRTSRLPNSLFFENTYINGEIEEIFGMLLRKIKPDVIHFQHLIGLSATLIEVAKDLGFPSVLTLHDYWFICPNIQLLKWDYTVCDGPEPDKCRSCWIKRQANILSQGIKTHVSLPGLPAKNFVEFVLMLLNSAEKFRRRTKYMKTLLLKIDLIIAPSKFLQRLFIKYGVPVNKIVHSENGYDLNVFKSFKKKKRNDNKVVFGYVGGIARHKGVHVLIDAFARVPEDKAELRIYGSYDPNSNYFRELLKKTKGTKNIKFMGRFTDVKTPYSEIDILVFPSIWYENCPLVLLEARATRTPVIASDLGAIPEFVEDYRTGLLFRPNDPDDLYKKIRTIINNPSLIKNFSNNIRLPRSIEDQAIEIESIYQGLIK